ncbi:hypothetical protein FJT64_013876 [Amphibalanus amphitrite]|uniref:Uncharacterized protein n=1 Tax=Amphibalanus amphitrite TaxID=1232801 RepID=A0A6A4V281_AMPAM|nr:hypothetical protein FJT64_013876 [Amphibalanus amphitrite]
MTAGTVLSSTVPAETLVGLQNLLVHLRDVSAENAHLYQYRLWDAKRVKVETAQNRVPIGAFRVRPATLPELSSALERMNCSKASGPDGITVSMLKLTFPVVGPHLLHGVSPDGAAGYRDGLRRATNGHPLSAEEVQKVVSRVNQLSS